MKSVLAILLITALAPCVAYCDSFDLRQVQGKSLVTMSQPPSGSCWTSSAVSAMESNLLTTGKWHVTEFPELPRLSAAHVQWWNGFNQHHNDDAHPVQGSGLDPNLGGDFRMVQAYAARAEGMVSWESEDPDPNGFNGIPERSDPNAHGNVNID